LIKKNIKNLLGKGEKIKMCSHSNYWNNLKEKEAESEKQEVIEEKFVSEFEKAEMIE
jgi:hypothetical protein